METHTLAHSITLEPNDARRLANLCGQFDQHLRQIEQRLDIEIRNRGNQFAFYGDANSARAAGEIISNLYKETGGKGNLTPDEIHLALQESGVEELVSGRQQMEDGEGDQVVGEVVGAEAGRAPQVPRQRGQLALPGELVVDPFVGSGTTAVVAERLGRRWIAGDADGRYLGVARQRLQELADRANSQPAL